jgi:CRISPR-associated protein Csd2
MSHIDPQTRHEFVLLFDVKDGNPNGDPDMDNMPRIDPETRHGLVTDVSLKRKVRDYVHVVLGKDIFIQSKVSLNRVIEEAGEAVGEKPSGSKSANDKVQGEILRRYYDVRMFGAVLSTGKLNAGQVRGPVQMTFARSVDPVYQHSLTITRQARTTEERMETGSTEMGRKAIVPYGLYRAHGFFNPFLAREVASNDLSILWEALENMYEFDRSASHGEMAVRGLYVFTHEDKKGNTHAHKLFKLVSVGRNSNGELPRAFDNYSVSISENALPEGVTLTRLVEP